MAGRGDARIVYSSGVGRVCPGCGWPAATCRCSQTRQSGSDPVPARIVAKLRTEKAGRRGKTVTVVFGLPRNPTFLTALCHDLKRACGTGGTVVDDTVHLQGDLRDRVRTALLARGISLKGDTHL